MLQIVDYSTTTNVLFEDLSKTHEVSQETLSNEFSSISKSTKKLGFKYSQYTRRLLLQGKLGGIKVKEQHYEKWYISNESIENYMNEHRRTQQLRRFVLKMDLENRDKVEQVLDELGIEYELELSYKGDKS